jgi:hypothetical protein
MSSSVFVCHSERSEESPHFALAGDSSHNSDWSGQFIDENIGKQQAPVNTHAVAVLRKAPLGIH